MKFFKSKLKRGTQRQMTIRTITIKNWQLLGHVCRSGDNTWTGVTSLTYKWNRVTIKMNDIIEAIRIKECNGQGRYSGRTADGQKE